MQHVILLLLCRELVEELVELVFKSIPGSILELIREMRQGHQVSTSPALALDSQLD